MPNQRFYQRHLPHEIPEGSPIFLTWNLKGSLPFRVIQQLQEEADRLTSESLNSQESSRDRKVRHAKAIFELRDGHLDADVAEFTQLNGSDGTFSLGKCSFRDRPMWLADPAAARKVVQSILWGVPNRYELFAFCVMGNHVHTLLTPSIPLAKITQGIKGFTAFQINRLHRQAGRTVWQDECYDHWPRDEEEFFKTIGYIEANPVQAGLCQEPNCWTWSSSFLRNTFDWLVGSPLAAEAVPEIMAMYDRLLDTQVR
jgi:REP element-mobilizing transposase RayT